MTPGSRNFQQTRHKPTLAKLYLLAKEILDGEERVARQEIVDSAKEAGIFDNNFTKVFGDSSAFMGSESEVGLRRVGREQAQSHLQRSSMRRLRVRSMPPLSQTNDRTEEHRLVQVIKLVRRRERRGDISGGPSARNQRLLEAWAATGPLIDGHKAIQDRDTRDKALIALWAIKNATGGNNSEVGRVILSNFIRDAFDSTLSEWAIEGALKAADATLVMQIQRRGFRITPTGVDFVEKLVAPYLNAGQT